MGSVAKSNLDEAVQSLAKQALSFTLEPTTLKHYLHAKRTSQYIIGTRHGRKAASFSFEGFDGLTVRHVNQPIASSAFQWTFFERLLTAAEIFPGIRVFYTRREIPDIEIRRIEHWLDFRPPGAD